MLASRPTWRIAPKVPTQAGTPTDTRMKIATLHDGSRSGQLIVVSRDLASAHLAAHIAGTLQQLLDDWNFLSPQLEDLYASLNGGKARHAFPFDPRACLAPLPRAHLWAPGPVLARSDSFLRPVGAVPLPARDSLPCRVQLAAVTGDVAQGADADVALDGVRLLLLAATWGAADNVLATAFSPLAATPDEVGQGWQAGLPAQKLDVRRRGAACALIAAQAAAGEAAGFGARIATLARWQALGAGSLVGGPALETGGGWMAGDSLHLELPGSEGQSVLGALALHVPVGAAGADAALAEPAAP